MSPEEQTIRAFTLPQRRDRIVCLLGNPKRRDDITRELAHFKWLDMRFAKKIAPNQQTPSAIAALLRSKGAGLTCTVISESSKMDGRELGLDEALREVVGYGMGTILSCIPGKLAYFEDEDERLLLERP